MLFTEVEFEGFVIEAVNNLPPFFLAKLENIDIIVEAWPTTSTLQRMKISAGSTLLGLYEGIPLTKRTSSYQMVAPDVITIFQGPIEQVSGHNPARIQAQVQHTVVHEIAHHFGISDERLIELGAY